MERLLVLSESCRGVSFRLLAPFGVLRSVASGLKGIEINDILLLLIRVCQVKNCKGCKGVCNIEWAIRPGFLFMARF